MLSLLSTQFADVSRSSLCLLRDKGSYDPPGNFHSISILRALHSWYPDPYLEDTIDDETQDGNILGAMLQVCLLAAFVETDLLTPTIVSGAVYIHGNWTD